MKVWSTNQMDSGNGNKKGVSPEDIFRGTVEKVTWTMDDRGNERLEVQIKDKETDKIRRWFYKYSEHKNSVWGRFIASLEKCGVALTNEEDLVGKTFDWEYTTINFGTDKTGHTISTKFLKPIVLVDEDEASWSDKDIEDALAKITGTISIETFMDDYDMPMSMSKRVLKAVMRLDEKNVIEYDPMSRKIKPKV